MCARKKCATHKTRIGRRSLERPRDKRDRTFPPAPPSHPRGRAPTMPISHAQRSSRTSIDHEGGGRRDVVDPQVHEAEPPPTSHLPKRETDERVARIFCFPRSNATSRRPFSAPGNCDDDDERG